jgi:hypothetical protein
MLSTPLRRNTEEEPAGYTPEKKCRGRTCYTPEKKIPRKNLLATPLRRRRSSSLSDEN